MVSFRVSVVSMLCNICMKLLAEVIRSFRLRYPQYADDIQLYLNYCQISRWKCLEEVMGVMRANKLKFNPNKVEFLLMRSIFLCRK